ncbi:MAG: hypothetical protein WC520_01350 [Candidatus Paceibacterota bacterium]
MKKNIIYLILILIILAVAVYLSFVYGFWQKLSEPIQNQEQEQQEEINFKQTGNIVKDNPGLEPNQWYLVYEQPGAPALNVKLSFDNNIVCLSNEAATPCSQVLAQGARVEIQGVKEDNTVLVKIITVIQ